MHVSVNELDSSSSDSRQVFSVEPEVAFASNARQMDNYVKVRDGDTRIHEFALASVVSLKENKGLYMPKYIAGPMVKIDFADLRQGMENIVVRNVTGGGVRSHLLSQPITKIDVGDGTFSTDGSGWLSSRGDTEIFQQHYWVNTAVEQSADGPTVTIPDANDGDYVLFVQLQPGKINKRLFAYDAKNESIMQNIALASCAEDAFTAAVFMLYPQVKLPMRTLEDIPPMPGAVPEAQPAPDKPEPAEEGELGGGIPPMPGDPSAYDRPTNSDWWTGKEK